MSERGPYDHGDDDLPPPSVDDDRDDLWLPTRPSVYPNDPGFAGFREPDPTRVMPIVGTELGDVGEDAPQPWYRQPGAVAALIAGGLALVVAAVAVFALGDDGGDQSLVEATVPSTSSTTTTSSSTSTTVVPAPVLPPAPPSSAPASGPTSTAVTTTVPPTTSSTTTTVASTTTAPPTTNAAATTVASATTTSSSSTTSTTATVRRPTTTTEGPTTAETAPDTTDDRPSTTVRPPSTDGSTTSTSPRPTTTTTPRGTTTTSSIPRQDTAWDYIVRSAVLRDLRRYILRADMVDVFERRGITVLAPIDQSFDDLLANPGGQALLEDPVRLRALLERHVIDDRLSERAIFVRTELPSIGGDVLVVDAEARTIDGGQIVDPDQRTANGSVLHVFDPVLLGDLLPS